MSKVYFTITPDYNSPVSADGTRTAWVQDPFLVECITGDEGLKAGDRIVTFFDPEGSLDHPYTGGWSSMGTVLHVNSTISRLTGETLAVIHYRDDLDS